MDRINFVESSRILMSRRMLRNIYDSVISISAGSADQRLYTDRQEFLDYFYELALKAKTQRAMSTVLLGPRRMGKTEIFIRVVNRLFREQDHRDPQAVIPVY